VRIYCSGIGGIGLSAYAALQQSNGHIVSGSDRTQTALTRDLQKQGITVFYDQSGSHVPRNADLFVYSEAIFQDAPERLRAREYSLTRQSYFEALGDLSRSHFVIAVCGTHGKSSTTSMAAKVLIDVGKDPTVIVGTLLPDLEGKNWRKGNSNIFLVEACEYRRSFLNVSPDVVIMTNVDGDHFDAFDSLDDYQKAFGEFVDLLPDNGVLITHLQDQDCSKIADQCGKKVIDADDIKDAFVSVPGEHMMKNAQLVLALADVLKVDRAQVLKSLKNYQGCWRRMELKGELKIKNSAFKIPVIDDYAHHPHEIRATIRAMREIYKKKRLVVLFQPHMHDRTLRLYKDFCSSFAGADVLLLTDVYDARHDVERESVRMIRFAKDCGGEYIGMLKDAEKKLRDILKPNDVLVCMGAGDITDLADRMII
jgi:UDP-N-acetylmuramate--alanine ligase